MSWGNYVLGHPTSPLRWTQLRFDPGSRSTSSLPVRAGHREDRRANRATVINVQALGYRWHDIQYQDDMRTRDPGRRSTTSPRRRACLSSFCVWPGKTQTPTPKLCTRFSAAEGILRHASKRSAITSTATRSRRARRVRGRSRAEADSISQRYRLIRLRLRNHIHLPAVVLQSGCGRQNPSPFRATYGPPRAPRPSNSLSSFPFPATRCGVIPSCIPGRLRLI